MKGRHADAACAKDSRTSQTGFSRRRFLQATALAGASVMVLPSRAFGANDRVRVGIIGLGNKGGQHVKLFLETPGAALTALCDVDTVRLTEKAELAKKAGVSPFTTTDPRRLLERKDVDAVIIATPNHWHVLLAMWAMDAGKDVYVEKPVSHNPWESVRLVEYAKAKKKIVQSGTQYRSDVGLRQAQEWLKAGNLGKPLWGHSVWYEYREAIGKCAPFFPSDLDYDLWCGPAPLQPLTRPRLDYHWHWIWDTGDGDLGNSGIHAFDICRWFAGHTGFPKRILGLGGRFLWDDAGQTPNSQLTLLDYPDCPIIVEIRQLPMELGEKTMDSFRQLREGFVVQYEGGFFGGLRAGGVVFDKDGKRRKEWRGDGGATHHHNFIEAVRSRKTATLRAPIQEGHVSSSCCLLGNLSYRMGKPTPKKNCIEAVSKQAQGAEAFDRLSKSLEGIGIDLDKTPCSLGPWLELKEANGDITAVSGGSEFQLNLARQLARGNYRAPYILPG